MDDRESLSSLLERLKLKALDSVPVVKMFDRFDSVQMSLIEVVSQSGQQYSSLFWAMLV